MARLILADTSAWHRSDHPAVAQRWLAHLHMNQIAVTAPMRLEVLYSAQSAADYAEMTRELNAVWQVPCGEAAFARAEQVQRRLGERAALHHRSVALNDLLIAAAAELAGARVWHYDADYERIAEVTGQPTEWIAQQGSLYG